jgi:antitoxin (DNA-binding transcriptional repressor) of toxin-antitoxin stability system
MKQVSISEFKSQFDNLVQEVFNGEEVEVRDNGHSFKLVPQPKIENRPRFGSAKGLFTLADDFDAPLEDFKDYT